MGQLRYYRIELKKIPRKYRRVNPLKVTRRSPFNLRKQVERFAVYFRREFGYPITEFKAKENREYTAYLFAVSDGTAADAWVGACCFRPESYSYSTEGETLRWVWIHPYQRRRGILSRAWAKLRANHGDFFVEPPLSPAMLRFVLKHNRDSQFSDFYRKRERAA
jgi:hypothetical protein